jgi:4-alpha-glucanotransferase
MWAVFPIQDLLGMSATLRRQDPRDEQINVPSNPTHYWRYRLHLNLEDLLAADDFNTSLRDLIAQSGRGAAC